MLQALLRLLDECQFSGHRAKLFSGERINSTENRAVLHAALRAQSTDAYGIDDQSVMADVFQARGHAYAFAEDIREGRVLGFTGEALTDVVNIGIGGSDLGPLMVSEALKPLIDGPRPHYVSNVDGAHLHDVLASLNPASTLILVASKTFTTQETMHNAMKAKRWIVEALGERRSAITLRRCRRTRRLLPLLAFQKLGCSGSGIGSVGDTRCGQALVYRLS